MKNVNLKKTLGTSALLLALLSTSAVCMEEVDDNSFPATPQRSPRPAVEVEELKANINRIQSTVDETLRRYPNARSVIVVGNTGNGKSTLVNLLAGRRFEASADEDDIGFKIRTSKSVAGIDIGETNESCTKVPSAWYDERNNVLFWDCPGFEDTRGVNEKIINAFAIHKLFRPGTKLLLLATEPDLEQNRSADFLKLLHNICDTFPDNADNADLMGSLSIIFNKQQNARNFRGFLRNRILPLTQEAQSHLTPAVRNLLSHLVREDRPNCIASLPRPIVVGSYTPNMQPIWDAINSSNYMRNPVPEIQLPTDAVLHVVKLARELNDSIVSYMEGPANAQIIDSCKRRIESHTSNVEGLRNYFGSLINKLREFRTDINLNEPRSFTNKLASIFGGTFDVSYIDRTIEQLNFLKSLNARVTNIYEMHRWIDQLSNPNVGPISYISELTNVESNLIPSIKLLSLRGLLVGTSDIARMLQGNNDVNRIDVFCPNTFFIDQDIQKLGCSFNIFAPHWIGVNGQRVIDISGVPGQCGANGVHGIGSDGQPGGLGGNGENFYGLCADSFSLDSNGVRKPLNLVVNVNGGPGGNGGDGGKGANGQHGTDGNPTICTSQEVEEWEELVPGKGEGKIKPFRRTVRLYENEGTEGQPGGEGGQPGPGGMGGYPGLITFKNLPIIPSSNIGSQGAKGNPGAGGSGGNHGGDCNLRVESSKQVLSSNWCPPIDMEKDGIKKWRIRDNGRIIDLGGHLAPKGKAEDGQPNHDLNDGGPQEPQENPDNSELMNNLRQSYKTYRSDLIHNNEYHARHLIDDIPDMSDEEESSNDDEDAN